LIDKIFGQAIANNLCDAVESCPERLLPTTSPGADENDRTRETEIQGFRVNKENFSMVCSLVKKGLLGAALGAGTLFLVFGTSAPSYVKTAFHKMRQSAKDSIDPRFEIERARTDIASLQPAFDQNKETLARAEVAAERLEREIVDVQASLDHDKGIITAMTEKLRNGDYRLTGHVNGTADEAKARLAHRLDQYKATACVLKEKQELLKAKKQTIEAAHQQLENLRTQKTMLLTQLARIEARLQSIEASQTKSEFNFDGSALARAKQTVSELEERLDVMSHKAEIDDKYGDIDGRSVPYADPHRDVLKEVDETFGPSSTTKTGNKSL
jgi:predicted  nucleic acid-binding Zn-ribbon protein